MEELIEKLKLTINHEYKARIGNSLVEMLSNEELEELKNCLEIATKEELFNFITVYHKEVKRLKLDIKELIENEL